jgi:hypothetical protein
MYRGKSIEHIVASYYSTGEHLNAITDIIHDQYPAGNPMKAEALPEIIKHCSLYPEDIQELFDMYVCFRMLRNRR